MRSQVRFDITDRQQFKLKLLQWSRGFEHLVYLDSNSTYMASDFEAVLAVGCHAELVCQVGEAFDQLDAFIAQQQDWMFGYLGYDLKNEIEKLSSSNTDELQFPDLHFVVPEKIIFLHKDHCVFSYREEIKDHIYDDYQFLCNLTDRGKGAEIPASESIKISLRTTKDSYFERFGKIQSHLQRGDIYEMNYCQEFYATNTLIDPWKTFEKLNRLAEAPFSTLVGFKGKFVLSSSPERYLKRTGNTVISQPIKGTSKRGFTAEEDQLLARLLRTNPKERSENIMITDLVRNDLSHVAVAGSVVVESLCDLHSFKQVHQLVSTIVATVPDQTTTVDLLRATFPMGSMTGAPKVAAMKIAEEVEDFKRGVYSGAVGYIKPDGDFDFNVVIRSILYNADTGYVSYAVGGAITAAANPQDEYEECLLKAKAMREVLEDKS